MHAVEIVVVILFYKLGIPSPRFSTVFSVLVALLGKEHAREKLVQALSQRGRTITTDRLTGLSIAFDANGCVEVVFASFCGARLLVVREDRDGGIFLHVGKLSISCARDSCPAVQLTLPRGCVPEDEYGDNVDLAVEGLFSSQDTEKYWPEVCAGFGAVHDTRAWGLKLSARLTSNIVNARARIVERRKIQAHA